jgi:hypothetical protein
LWLGSPDEDRWMRQMSRAERAALDAQCVEMLDRGDGSNEIAHALDVPQQWVMACARRHRRNLGVAGRKRRSRKMDQHEPRIRALIAAGKSDAAIAREIDEHASTVNYFIKRRGLRHPIKGAAWDPRESAVDSAAPSTGESAESGSGGQFPADYCTDSAQRDLFEAAD